MSGGRTNQNSNYNSSISFSPVISDHGSITNGDISTGSTNGSVSGSSSGGGGNLGLSFSPKLQNLALGGYWPQTRQGAHSLQTMPFSCGASISCNVGPVHVNGGFSYSHLL